ncbi:MAG: hypothetical protein M0R66_07330 [Candidatus Omnitrophica bacterium]|jgi:hypothetical protein|nr:hypothetical protein [Candidatus Omnitrophota bacterium]
MRTKAGLLGVFLLGLLALSCSCSVPEAYVAADRATYDVVAPRFLNYLQADPTLDQVEKDREARTIAAWDLRIRKAEGR